MAYRKRQSDFDIDPRYLRKIPLENYRMSSKRPYSTNYNPNSKNNKRDRSRQRDFYPFNATSKRRNYSSKNDFDAGIRNIPGSFTKKFAKTSSRTAKPKKNYYRSRFYSKEEKMKLIKEYESVGAPMGIFCKWYGIGVYTFKAWYDRYIKTGEQGLFNKKGGKKQQEIPADIRADIIRIKLENPGVGSHKISDWLNRNKFIRIGALRIRKILMENPQTAAIMTNQVKRRHGNSGKEPERFERSKPREMYQMDIMTFFLQGLYRVYVIACLDDYSRFVASIGLFRRQTTDRCLDVLRAAIERYGMPKEMLTDNGRQFYTWRGTSEFQKYLVQSGIKHIRSSPHHPETLGKIESLWRNMYQELISKEPMNSFEDAEEKIKAWIQWYNFKRPHQGIGGLVPADRFFGVEGGMRDVMEKGAVMVRDSMAADPKQVNEPVYFIGKAGGKEIRIIAREGTMTVDGPGKTLENKPQEEKHGEVVADSPRGKQPETGGQVPQEDPGRDKVQDGAGCIKKEDPGKTGRTEGGSDERNNMGVDQEIPKGSGKSAGIQPQGQEREGLCEGQGVKESAGENQAQTGENSEGKQQAPGGNK